MQNFKNKQFQKFFNSHKFLGPFEQVYISYPVLNPDISKVWTQAQGSYIMKKDLKEFIKQNNITKHEIVETIYSKIYYCSECKIRIFKLDRNSLEDAIKAHEKFYGQLLSCAETIMKAVVE